MIIPQTVKDLFQTIEAVEFDVRLNVVSSRRQFEAVARAQPEFRQLAEGMQHPDYGEAVFEAINARCEALLQNPGDVRYSHIHDVALATYLLALQAVGAPRTLEWSVKLARLSTGAWCRRVGNRLASTLGLGYRLDWNGADTSNASRAVSMQGALTIRVGAEQVWQVTGDLGDLLKHMCEHWATLAYQDGYPFALDARTPLDFAVKTEEYLDNLPETRRESARQQLSAFQSAHQLGRSMESEHPLWLLRQGNDVWVASRRSGDQEQIKLLPRLQVFSVLRALGDELAQRAVAASQSDLALRWDAALDVDQDTILSLLTGLDEQALERLQVPVEELPSANGEEHEWMAAARMLASADLHALIPEVLEIVSTVESSPSALLDEESKQSLARLAFYTHQRPFEQGQAIAQWLRIALELGGEPVQPSELLARWGVPVLERTLGHPDVDAIAMWGPRHGPAIILNKGSEASDVRVRATLAHEIAHLLLDRQRALPLAEVLGGNVPTQVEQRARAFAAELLMPGSVAADAFGAESDRSAIQNTLRLLASRYGVSHEIVAWQARNHGMLSPEAESVLRHKVSRPWLF